MSYSFLINNNPQNQISSNIGSPLDIGIQNIEDDQNLILIIKVISLVVIAGLTLIFGFLPLLCTTCRRSTKILGLANAFSGGLFMGIALFHLLPESSENLENYFSQNDKDSIWGKLPTPFFISFISYSLILLVEKVAFDSHSITEHDHGGHSHSTHHAHEDGHSEEAHSLKKPLLEEEHAHAEGKEEHNHNHNREVTQKSTRNSKVSAIPNKEGSEDLELKYRVSGASNNSFMKSSLHELLIKNSPHPMGKDAGYEEDIEENDAKKLLSEDEDEDNDEQTLKNVVSSKGKFASYLQARNILQSKQPNMKIDKSLLTASKILERTHVNRQDSIDKMCITNIGVTPKKVTSFKFSPRRLTPKNEQLEQIGEIKELEKVETEIEKKEEKGHIDKHHFNPKSNLTPYLLLIALSVHGLFEGTALGVQRDFKDCLFLGIAIVSHKWAESFTLGISFYKSGTERNSYIRMIVLFSVFTPIGILLGLLVISADELTQGIFLSISAGTFIYISCSEVIVEEFAITKYRYQKYFLFLCGGLLVALLSYFEVQNNVE